ncbi:MAG: glycosyltransferase family 4 protein [Candidatus Coatesbacteria bacterium]
MLLQELLPRLRPHGIEVSLILFGRSSEISESLTKTGVPCLSLDVPATSIYRLDRWVRVRTAVSRIFQRGAFDVVHSHLFMADLVSRLAGSAQMRLMSTLHGTDPWWFQRRRVRSGLKRMLDSFTGRWKRVRYAAVNHRVLDMAIANLGISRSRCRIIHNGVDLTRFSPRRRGTDASSRDEWPHILQIGRMDANKNQALTMRAFAKLRAKHPHARLSFVGTGPLLSQLVDLRGKLGLEDCVVFLGVRNDVPSLLRDSDLLVLSSVLEGQPMVLLEAMASALPVITTDIAGIRDMVEDNVTGIVVSQEADDDMAQAMIRLADDPALLLRLGAEGRRKAEQSYSVEMTAEQYASAYRDLIEARW